VPTQFKLPSSDPALLEKATRIANEYARQFKVDGIAGMVFLGAIARGYYDKPADGDAYPPGGG
jgi:hypothetical protein